MGSLFFHLSVLLVGIVSSLELASAFFPDSSDEVPAYYEIKRGYESYLKRLGFDGIRRRGIMDLASIRNVLKEANRQRPNEAKKNLIKMANVSVNKCDATRIKDVVPDWNNHWYLPGDVKRYIDHYQEEQLDTCLAKFRDSIEEGAKAFAQKDLDRMANLLEHSRKGSDCVGTLLAGFLVDEFGLPKQDVQAKHIDESLNRMATWCEGAMEKLEPGAGVIGHFRAKAFKRHDDHLFQLVGCYQICQLVRDQFDRVTASVQEALGVSSAQNEEAPPRSRMEQYEREYKKEHKKEAKRQALLLFAKTDA